MSIVASKHRPWYGALSSTSVLVPAVYDCALDGRPYMIDTTFEFGRRDSFRHSSIPATRDATDISNIPGENSINIQGLWRREAQDWSLGAGQRFFDRQASFPNRFRASKGVDVSTNQWYASLLKDTTQVVASADSALQVLVVGSYVYSLTSSTLQYSADLSTWTSVTGLPASGLVMMATDGNTVYIACGANGLYTATAGSAPSTHYVTSGTIDFVAYCSNVLLVSSGASLYQITATGALPAALITQNNANWRWNCATGGFGWIYISGNIGSKSAIYKTQMETDGTALTAPVVSGPLPPGEQVYSLYSFVNFVFVGTSKGARFCQTLSANDPGGSSGDLKIGPIIPNLIQPVSKPVHCFVAQNRFAYFGWSNYDSASTGIGRIDISQFTGTQTPAYASDLMVTGLGEITSMDWFNSAPIFVVSGLGIYTAAATYVPAGTINSGFITFGIPDKKVLVAYSVDVVEPINGTIAASVSADDGTAVSLGTSAIDPPPVFSIPQTRGELFETTLTMNSGSANTTTPTIRRATIQGLPTVTAGKEIIVAFRLYAEVETHNGRRMVDCPLELAYLENLRSSQKVVNYQQGNVTWEVTVMNIDMVYYERAPGYKGFFDGICVTTLQTLGGLIV